MTARIGRPPLRRCTSEALCRKLAALISTQGSKDESRTVGIDAPVADTPFDSPRRDSGSPSPGRPNAEAAAEAFRNARREVGMGKGCHNPAMKKHLLTIGVAVALTAALWAQTRAPQNESITKEDLRADLFFLAGDSLRGRLTDTVENRAAADFIASRFERMGLKGAGANGAFFQP